MFRDPARRPAVASHEKLGEYHRLQYLVMLQPSLLPVGRLLRADPMRLLRLANARYIAPVAVGSSERMLATSSTVA